MLMEIHFQVKKQAKVFNKIFAHNTKVIMHGIWLKVRTLDFLEKEITCDLAALNFVWLGAHKFCTELKFLEKQIACDLAALNFIWLGAHQFCTELISDCRRRQSSLEVVRRNNFMPSAK
jgi:hypothetical protein